MKANTIPNTDLEVSVIAMGCWAIAAPNVWGPQNEQDAIDTIHAAMDIGINFFDTAEAYGDGLSETLLAKGLAKERNHVVIASKVRPAHMAREEVMRACERSLKRLKTDYIDLYQLHWPVPEVPLSETYEALSVLHKQGKIRTIGVSNFGVQDLSAFLELGACVTDQLPYNLFWRAIEYEILPFCRDNQVGVLCYSPLAQGLLTGKYKSLDEVPEGRQGTRFFSEQQEMARHGDTGCEAELFQAIHDFANVCKKINVPMADCALAWLLHQPGVHSVIAGARHPRQIRMNAKAAELHLDEDVLSSLDQLSRPVKEKIGKNADMWQSESRIR